jgi:Zn finger protein HypA/HybF involved in hydrogenase expression
MNKGLKLFQLKQKIKKLKGEGKTDEVEKVQVEINELETGNVAGGIESPKDESAKPETKQEPKLAEGFIKCGRCGFVFEKSKSVYVALFGKNGCPKCGFSI